VGEGVLDGFPLRIDDSLLGRDDNLRFHDLASVPGEVTGRKKLGPMLGEARRRGE
jgi:hypothetical protein